MIYVDDFLHDDCDLCAMAVHEGIIEARVLGATLYRSTIHGSDGTRHWALIKRAKHGEDKTGYTAEDYREYANLVFRWLCTV